MTANGQYEPQLPHRRFYQVDVEGQPVYYHILDDYDIVVRDDRGRRRVLSEADRLPITRALTFEGQNQVPWIRGQSHYEFSHYNDKYCPRVAWQKTPVNFFGDQDTFSEKHNRWLEDLFRLPGGTVLRWYQSNPRVIQLAQLALGQYTRFWMPCGRGQPVDALGRPQWLSAAHNEWMESVFTWSRGEVVAIYQSSKPLVEAANKILNSYIYGTPPSYAEITRTPLTSRSLDSPRVAKANRRSSRSPGSSRSESALRGLRQRDFTPLYRTGPPQGTSHSARRVELPVRRSRTWRAPRRPFWQPGQGTLTIPGQPPEAGRAPSFRNHRNVR